MPHLTFSLWVVLAAVLCGTRLVAADSYVATFEWYPGDSLCSGSFYGGAAPSTTFFAQLETHTLADCARYLKDFATSFYYESVWGFHLGECEMWYYVQSATSFRPSCSLLPASVSLESFATQTLGGFQDHLSGKLWRYNNLTNCSYFRDTKTNVTVIASQQYDALDLCLPTGVSGASQRVVVAEDQHSLHVRFWNASGNCSGDPVYTANLGSCTAGSLISWPEPSITPTVSPTPVIPSPSSTPLPPSPSTSASVPTGSGGPAAPNTSTPVSSPAAVGSSGIVSKPIEFFGLMFVGVMIILFV